MLVNRRHGLVVFVCIFVLCIVDFYEDIRFAAH